MREKIYVFVDFSKYVNFGKTYLLLNTPETLGRRKVTKVPTDWKKIVGGEKKGSA